MSETNCKQIIKTDDARDTNHNTPGRQALMLHKPPAAGRGCRATASPRALGPTYRKRETQLGSDEHLQKEKGEERDRGGWTLKMN